MAAVTELETSHAAVDLPHLVTSDIAFARTRGDLGGVFVLALLMALMLPAASVADPTQVVGTLTPETTTMPPVGSDACLAVHLSDSASGAPVQAKWVALQAEWAGSTPSPLGGRGSTTGPTDAGGNARLCYYVTSSGVYRVSLFPSVILLDSSSAAATSNSVTQTWGAALQSPLPVSLPSMTVGVRVDVVLATGGAPPYHVVLTGGTLPPGLSLSDDGHLVGSPTANGAFNFSLDLSDAGGDLLRNVGYSASVYPAATNAPPSPPSSPPSPTSTPAPAPTPTTSPPADTDPATDAVVAATAPALGAAVLVAPRTKTSGCRLGANPDRRCSPGAYYTQLTKAVICSPSFRMSTISNVRESEKFRVEREYGMTPRRYGRTLEIDHIVSLELGGSNDIANLFPQSYAGGYGYPAKDRLERKLHTMVCSGAITLRASQRGIATNWRALYAKVFGKKAI